LLLERNATLSNPVWFSFDRKKSESFSGVRSGTRLRQLLDRSPTARAAGPARLGAVLSAEGVRVAGFVEEELLEVRAWPELAVLGSLERRRLRGLRERVRVERRLPVDSRVMDGDPFRV